MPRPLRILICECKQEISSFNPVLGVLGDYAITSGSDVFRVHRGVTSEVCGALDVCEADTRVEAVPGYSARAITSGGTLNHADFLHITNAFLDAVRNAQSIDAIYFALHGALAAEQEHDVEGYLLEQTRAIVGEQMPIVASFDLHGIITDRILTHANAITLYHTYPHVDFYQTGARAARLLLRILFDNVKPVTVRLPIPALVRGYELITETGKWGACVRRAIAVENGPRGLSGGMFIGNPFTDVPDLCSNVLLVTDNDPELAERDARAIAAEFWEMRHHLQQPLTPLAESIRIAAETRGYTVLVDAADATSSGASGDSNAILRAMIEAGYSRTVILPIVDAPAVQAAFAAGIGATITVPVGGSLDKARFTPLPITAKVRLLSDGLFRNESHGSYWNAGPTAVLESGNYTVIATTKAVSLYDRSLFLAHGHDPAHFDTVIVKSPHCQPHMFSDLAARMINVDAPGSTSANLPYLGHTRCRRPIFPLDPNVEFHPAPRFFTRVR